MEPVTFINNLILSTSVILVVSAISSIFWVLMLIDLLERDFKNKKDETTWLIVLLLTGVIGAIVYYAKVKRLKSSNDKQRHK